ncbi:MAG: lysophospholipid acyltransferase family protein [Acidobacteriota bacterium]|nr:lysophospholipid acyltransferase family protein [Acidobacteriota bacterium]
MITTIGLITYPGLALFNRLEISGAENLVGLPPRNVLFVSNHTTYFAEVIAFLHVFCAVKGSKINRLGAPSYLASPFIDAAFVASVETMSNGPLARLLGLAGAVLVKRTWRAGELETRRERDPGDTQKILAALRDRWVITFPQGTTRPHAPGRKGTAHLIRQSGAVVVPVVARGFDRVFGKKGLRIRRIGESLSVAFKPPLVWAPGASPEDILDRVMDAIEENERHWTPTR